MRRQIPVIIEVLVGVLCVFVGVAHAQGSAMEAEAAMAAGNFTAAGEAFRRAYDETGNPTHLKNAGEAFIKTGPKGREAAIEALTLLSRQARTIDEADEAADLLARARALPEPVAPEPPPPTPPPAPPVVSPPASPPDAPPVVAVSPVPQPSSASLPAAADAELWDVLYLQDGSIVRGLLVGHIPGADYRVTLPDGGTVVIPAQTVRELRKEPNPDYQRQLVLKSESKEVLAGSGFRGTAGAGIALPIGRFGDTGPSQPDFDPSFDVFGRIGWEFIWGQFGLWPAARVEYIRWSNSANAAHNLLHIGADVRLSAHMGRVVPYLVLGGGADLNYFEVENFSPGLGPLDVKAGKGFGFHVGPGLDILLSPHAAVGFSVSYHPGFTDFATGDDVGDSFRMSYIAFAAGFSIYQ